MWQSPSGRVFYCQPIATINVVEMSGGFLVGLLALPDNTAGRKAARKAFSLARKQKKCKFSGSRYEAKNGDGYRVWLMHSTAMFERKIK